MGSAGPSASGRRAKYLGRHIVAHYPFRYERVESKRAKGVAGRLLATREGRGCGTRRKLRERVGAPLIAGRCPNMADAGLQSIFLANRERLLRFLVAHGAGDAAEDLLQEVWIKIAAPGTAPIGQPLSYLFRVANNLMLDRYRSAKSATKRDIEWTAAATTRPGTSDQPIGERPIIAREHLQIAERTLQALGERPAAIFRRFRLDGISQRQIAAEMGISLSTVEADLRRAYSAMLELRRRLDEA